jgi:hypothetical protein
MNYETATDFELNEKLLMLVAEKNGDKIAETRPHRLAEKMKCFSHVVFRLRDCHEELKVNYCTDWNATMPLAIEYGVELSPCFNGWWFAGVVDSYTYEEEVLSYSGITTCENPLRAIVICLIKVLEANK